MEYPRWASLDRIQGVWPKKNPGPLGPISYTNGTPTSPREFYPKEPSPKMLYSLTWSQWILSKGTLSKDAIFTYLVPMNFIHQHLLQTVYIHLPGLHEFYPGTPPQCSQIWFWIIFLCTMYAWGLCPFLGMDIYCEKNLAPRIFISHIPVLNFAGADLHIEPHMCANPSWTNVPRHTTKPQTPRFSSHTSLFWTLPEQISILYPTCAPTHPEPMSQDTPQNLRPQDFHLTHPCFELCRSRSPYYTPHVRQPILNQCPKTHHKTSDPKIFISHIPVLNFAGTDLHIIPHMCGNPSWTNVPRHTTKPQTPRFSSHTSLFWTLPEQISILYPTCVPTHPEPMSQDTPQNLRPQDFHLTHPCFELCRNRSPYYTPHVWQPILNQCPKTHHTTSDPKIFISQIPVLNFAGADLHIIPHMCANPSWTNVPRHTTKSQTPRFSSHTSLFWTLPEQISILYPTCVPTHPEPMSQDRPQNLRPQDFHLTHPCFELCRNRSPYYTPHVCQPILNQCPKTHHKTSDPKIFISHIPVLNFAGTDLHIEPRMCANPSWTNVPRHTTKPQTPRFSSHTSLFWTLPEQISILYPTCVATHLEPMSQDTPRNLRP